MYSLSILIYLKILKEIQLFIHMKYFLYKVRMSNDTSSILWLSSSYFLKLTKTSNGLSNTWENNNQKNNPLNIFSVPPRTGKARYLKWSRLSILHGFELAGEKTFYSTCHISKLNAINNTSPKLHLSQKPFPTVCCAELWPKSQCNLNTMDLATK